uniref:UPAR/Ly6 domain-containing protein n=1 Tax=Takifugu rubripes TaxID=31033 RepID=A0A674NC48_TAKRU
NVYAMLLGKSQTVFMSLFYAAQCLTCNLCIFLSSDITTANATASLSLGTGGCVNSFVCGSSSGSILGFDYNVSVKCCNTDLCNGASSLQLPLIVTLCFGTLTSLWVMT